MVAQITPGNIAHSQVQNQVTPVQPQLQAATATPARQIIQQPQVTPEPTPKVQDTSSQIDQATMDQLLVGQPPGTIIKCVTAQVIQTQQGPRIVLQGLQGADFTPQQLSAVQHQVKQQLLKGYIDFLNIFEVLKLLLFSFDCFVHHCIYLKLF